MKKIIENSSMEWNVYIENPNSQKIEKYNIFNHMLFSAGVEEAYAICRTKEEFSEKIRKELLYYFWSKCEYEVVVCEWPPRVAIHELDRIIKDVEEYENKWNKKPYSLSYSPNCAIKISIYDQVMLNWDNFIEYLWWHKPTQKR